MLYPHLKGTTSIAIHDVAPQILAPPNRKPLEYAIASLQDHRIQIKVDSGITNITAENMEMMGLGYRQQEHATNGEFGCLKIELWLNAYYNILMGSCFAAVSNTRNPFDYAPLELPIPQFPSKPEHTLLHELEAPDSVINATTPCQRPMVLELSYNV